MGKNFHETLNEQLKDPEFRAEWEALEPERQIIRSIIEKDEPENVTMAELEAMEDDDEDEGAADRL